MLLAACKAAGPGEAVGVSANGGAAAASSARNADARGAPDAAVLPKGYATTFRKLIAEPVVSEGHGVGRFVVTVYASDVAATAYDKGRAPYPVGAIFVAEHAERASTAARGRGPTFMMERLADGDAGAGGWRYTAIDGDGNVAPAEAVTMCTACHVDAPRDSVFPVAVAAPAPAPPTK